MAAKIVTEYGNILIDNEVVARIAGLAALDVYGVVGMATPNMKDGFVQLLLGDSLTKGIKVDTDEEGKITLEFHVIVEYGTKISAIADNLIDTVRYRVSDILGAEVSHVDIYVEGVRVDKTDK